MTAKQLGQKFSTRDQDNDAWSADSCAEVQRCLVVQVLSSVQPQRSLSERHSYLVRCRCELGQLERPPLLAEVHRDEAEAVLKLSTNVQCHARMIDFGNIM